MHIIPFQPRHSCTYTLTLFLPYEIQNVPACSTIKASLSSKPTSAQLTPFLCMQKGCNVAWFSFSLCCLPTHLRVSQLPPRCSQLYKNVCSSNNRHDASLCQNILWMRRLVWKLQQALQFTEYLEVANCILYSDNIATFWLVSNAQVSAKNKHNEVCFHYIRNHIKNGALVFAYVASGEKFADLLMKAVQADVVQNVLPKRFS